MVYSTLNSFNSQPPEGGWLRPCALSVGMKWFQLTAARRRLDLGKAALGLKEGVSTHSRPKAAGQNTLLQSSATCGFNSQPPEGGWIALMSYSCNYRAFQLTAARRRLESASSSTASSSTFQLTAARRRLVLCLLQKLIQNRFQLTAARRRLDVSILLYRAAAAFQLTAARRRLA